MATQIQVRRDTTANWAAENPILAEGEFGYDETLAAFKVGDGINTWSALSFYDTTTVHAAAADPHTGYRLESADHTHATTGLQGGTVAGSALTGTPGGELGGTFASFTVDATHAGSTHSAASDAHVADTSAAHAASSISIADAGNDFTATDVEGALDEIQADNETHAGAADPHTGYRLESADHTHATTGAEGGTIAGSALTGTPGGELGGTFASFTVDATHSGSTHAATQAAAEATAASADSTHAGAADPHAGYVLESLYDAKGDIITASADNTPSKLTAGSDDTILMADSSAGGGLKWVASASPSAVGTAAATGTSDTFTRGDHVHAHEAAHIAHDTLFDAAGDLVVGSAADTAVRLAIGADDKFLRSDGTTAVWEAVPFSISFVMSNNGSAIPTGIWPVWVALFPCTVTGVKAYGDTGTTTVVNAGTGTPPENSDEDFCSSDITINPADAVEVGTVDQNQAVAAGEIVSVEVKTAGTSTQVLVQIDFTRP